MKCRLDLDFIASGYETQLRAFGRSQYCLAWMGATHLMMKTLKHLGTEMALHVLAYNLKRVIAILGVPKLLAAI